MRTSPGGLEAAITAETEECVSPVTQASVQSDEITSEMTTPVHGDAQRAVHHELMQPVLESTPRTPQMTDRIIPSEPGNPTMPINLVSGGPSDLDPTTEGSTINNHRLDLRTLMSANPLESEAEAYIQRSIEENDPTMGYRDGSEAQKTILGPNVPLDAAPDTFGEVIKPVLQSPKAKKGHKPVKSTAEDLFQLAMDMTALNKQHGSASLHGSELNTRESLSVLHAAKPMPSSLVKRAASKLKVKVDAAADSGGDGTEEAAPSPGTPVDRWNRLKRKAAAVTLMPSPRPHLTFSDSTKFEENAGDAATGDDGDDKEAAHGAGSPDEANAMKRTASKRKDGFRPTRSLSQRKRSREAAGRFRKASKDRFTLRRFRRHYKDFEDWFRVKQLSLFSFLKIILAIILPATAIAAILFYAAGNPRVGYAPPSASEGSLTSITEAADSLAANTDADTFSNSTSIGTKITEVLGKASWSWWILFVFVRQVLTLSLSFASQALVIEYAILRSKMFVRIFGSFMTLFVIQSRGWPFVVFMWSIYDFAFLYGGHPWSEHWLWWQTTIDMMNEKNPSGRVTDSKEYLTVLVIMTTVSFVVMLKRFWLSLFLGKQTYIRYGGDLAKVMRKSLLIGQVSALARDKEDLMIGDVQNDLGIDLYDEYGTLVEDDVSTATEAGKGSTRSINSAAVTILKGKGLTRLQKNKIDQLLGAWEEPEVVKDREERIAIAAIIQFRQSLTFLNTGRPFSVAFGPASTRAECIQSSEAVYSRLVGASALLKFDLLALLAIDDDGEVDDDKLKELIHLFRPDRQGNLSLLDFAKSVDTVYKELRLLRASVANSSKMDRAFENIVNIVFYFLVILCVLAGIGIAPDSVLSPVGAFIVGLGFMIGSASSKALEGILFILVRRPYDIGDRINISDPLKDTPATGSPGWIVLDLDLYSTTVIYAATNEQASYTNGSLASSRTINMARSFKAQISCTIRFPIDAPYEKLLIFKKSIEQFILSRPREFASFVAFRATTVQADLGFVEYVVYALHRESWQEAPTIAQSKADLNSFALELSKKMGLRYHSPPMPIDLTLLKQGPSSPDDKADGEEAIGPRLRSGTVGSFDIESVAAMFETKR